MWTFLFGFRNSTQIRTETLTFVALGANPLHNGAIFPYNNLYKLLYINSIVV